MPDQRKVSQREGRGAGEPLDMDIRVLDIRVLGLPALSVGGRPCELSGKSLALVCYLALEGETHRAELADLLWTDGQEDSGRRNLRRELHRLRQGPVGEWIGARGECLWLRPGHTLDLHEFRRLLGEGRSAQAAALLRGPLLEGLCPPSAGGFAEWREACAAQLTEASLSALSIWASELGQQGALAAAQEVYARMLRLDPLREQTCRNLMRLLYRAGEPEAALTRYRALEDLLARELGVSPLPETRALHRQILEGRMPSRQLPDPRSPEAAEQAAGAQPADTQPLHLPLVGRAEALQTLARNRVVLVTGEAGVGKTRLIREFLGHAHRTLIQGSPETTLLPFAPLAALFAGRPELLNSLGGAARAGVERVLHASGGESGDSGTSRDLAPESPQTLALTEALQTVVGDGVLVVEDLHWLDAPTLGVVVRLIRGVSAGRQTLTMSRVARMGTDGRVLLSARHTDLETCPQLAAMTAGLERGGQLIRLPLRELDPAQVERLIARLSGQDAPKFSRRLHQATAGHPLFLLETLRSLRESGDLQTGASLWQTRYDQHTADYSELSIPESVEAAVLLRLSRLGDAAGRLLHAAAVAGEPFGVELHGVCGLSECEALDLLERAEQAHLIVCTQCGIDQYRFGHDLYRHALLGDMTQARRRLIHRQLGRRLEARARHQTRPDPASHPARIAAHFEQAGEWQSARPHWQEAARRSAQVGDQAGALAHCARALSCLNEQSGHPTEAAADLHEQLNAHQEASEVV